MCMTMKSSYSCVSYNNNDGDNALWNQYSGTSITLTANMKSCLASKRTNPIKLGRWTWVWIEGKVGESTVFVSAYKSCNSINGMSIVWIQHDIYYYQNERGLRSLMPMLFSLLICAQLLVTSTIFNIT